MASSSLNPVSGKIDNSMNLFRQNINEKRAEVNRIREEMKLLIDQKSDELLGELDRILEEVNEKEKKRKELDQNIREIQEYQTLMEDLFRKMDPSFTQITEISERIEKNKKEIDIVTPEVKLNWKMNALRDSINNMCKCNVQDVPANPDPVTPKPDLRDSKLESSGKTSKASVNIASRVIAFFVVNGKDVEIHGTILKTLSDKSGQVYYELHTDIPVRLQVRNQEIKLKVRRATQPDNSLFVRTDQCFPEIPDNKIDGKI